MESLRPPLKATASLKVAPFILSPGSSDHCSLLLAIYDNHWSFLHSAPTFVNYALNKPFLDCPNWSMSCLLLGPRVTQTPALDFLGCLSCRNQPHHSTSSPGSRSGGMGRQMCPHSPLLPQVPAKCKATLQRPSVCSSSLAGIPGIHVQVAQARASFPQGTPPL